MALFNIPFTSSHFQVWLITKSHFVLFSTGWALNIYPAKYSWQFLRNDRHTFFLSSKYRNMKRFQQITATRILILAFRRTFKLYKMFHYSENIYYDIYINGFCSWRFYIIFKIVICPFFSYFIFKVWTRNKSLDSIRAS